MGTAVFQPYGLALLAKASPKSGQREEGLAPLEDGLVVRMDQGKSHWQAEFTDSKANCVWPAGPI